MCMACIDKINDFYEYRLMSEHVDKQTREGNTTQAKAIIFVLTLTPLPALGLPAAQPVPKPVFLQPQVRLFDLKESLASIPTTSKKRAEKPDPSPQPPPKKSKKNNVSCTICVDTHFGYQNDLTE